MIANTTPWPKAAASIAAWLCCLALASACDADSATSASDVSQDEAASSDSGGPGDGVSSAEDGVTGQDAAQTDAAPDAADATDVANADVAAPIDVAIESPGPCGPTAKPRTFQVVLPLGETLFFAGDDYLAFWPQELTCAVSLVEQPKNAKAGLAGSDTVGDHRLTPDQPGLWRLQRGADTVDVNVVANYWTEDTFSNHNYAPTQPLVVDPSSAGDGSKGALWVTATTSAQLQRIDLFSVDAPASVKAVAGPAVPVGGWPTAVAVWPESDFLVVTQTARDTLGFVSRSQGVLVDAVRVGDEPHNIVIDGVGPQARGWVALAGEDRVVRVHLDTRSIEASVSVGREPRAMAFDVISRHLYVASLISGNAHPKGLLQKGEPVAEAWLRDVVIVHVDKSIQVGVIPEVGTINRGLYLEPAAPGQPAGALLVATSHADNTKAQISAETRPHAHHLVRVDLGAAGAAPKVALDHDLDIHPVTGKKKPAASPYSLLRTPDGAYLAATLSAGGAVLFARPDTLHEVGRVPTGHDPRGLVMAIGRLWTYSWLSNQVEGIELPAAATLVQASGLGAGSGKPAPNPKMVWAFSALPGPNVVVGVGADPTPKDVRAGQQIFNDAAFSKYGDFSCNNCHVDGVTDGLTWDLLVDGPVNTLAFRNIGGTEPFLWGGQLPTLFDFSREVLKLVGAQASGKQMEQLTRYMQSVTAPPNPAAGPGGKLDAVALHGRAVFQKPVDAGGAGCASCHGGPLGTTGMLVEGKTKGEQTDVPSLLGVYDTAPYGRQGQWFDLPAMLDFALTFTGAKLNQEDRDAVLAYLRQLPGDLLVLNSARPLAGASHVWKEVKPELLFSAVLALGQEPLFAMMQLDADGKATPVAGAWKISGRAARFEVQGGALKLESSYRIDVQAGLKSALGQSLPQALQIAFTTGGVPAFDVSGQWKMMLASKAVGQITVNIAVLMAEGGKMTGVVLDAFDQASLAADAITGVVSGKTLQLDPFYVNSDFGQFYVKDGFASTLEDSNSDGFADKGTGAFDFKFGETLFPIAVTWKRTALPKG